MAWTILLAVVAGVGLFHPAFVAVVLVLAGIGHSTEKDREKACRDLPG